MEASGKAVPAVESERADRLVAALRDRGVMAHVAETGVYEFGIRVVLDLNVEALWDMGGGSGLEAEVLSEGGLVGFVPHIPGSEDFTDQQLIDAIATTNYSTEGLHPPADGGSDGGSSAPAAPAAAPTSRDAKSGRHRRRPWHR